jgi:c-di-AMP phosphodiesterase-like protein
MSDEILYLIIFIISIFIISKVCNICLKNIIVYIIIVLTIIYFINKVNYNRSVDEPFLGSVKETFSKTIKEPFSESVGNLCNIIKDNLANVVSKTSTKCIKDVKKDSKDQINDAIDCYNFTGNEIVTTNNVSSWCDLNSVDIDIINKAIEKI